MTHSPSFFPSNPAVEKFIENAWPPGYDPAGELAALTFGIEPDPHAGERTQIVWCVDSPPGGSSFPGPWRLRAAQGPHLPAS